MSKIIPGIVLLTLLSLGSYYVYQNNFVTSAQPSTTVHTQKITLDKSFELSQATPSADVKPLKVTIQTAQLSEAIFVNGERKDAKEGTKYLMINAIVENPNDRAANFTLKDILRLIDESGKKFAPSSYNNTLRIDADASKKDNAGFVVPDNIKTFKIQYGFPARPIEVLELQFQ